MFKQGEILSIKWHLGIEHDGIYTAKGTVIAASKRTGIVIEEDIETFSGGRKVISKGFPSALLPEMVEKNARSKLGKTYNLLGYNCQHFASECHGKKKSRQLRSIVLSIAATAALIALSRIRGKRT
ncbi:MAG: lecithin retinol acyltransferase family protein [Alphaproteobacteria bacterium]